jgi:hypothetical protein
MDAARCAPGEGNLLGVGAGNSIVVLTSGDAALQRVGAGNSIGPASRALRGGSS